MNRLFLSVERMADCLCVSPFWLWEQAEAGLVPGVHTGDDYWCDSYIFDPDAVKEALSVRAAEESKHRREGEQINDQTTPEAD